MINRSRKEVMKWDQSLGKHSWMFLGSILSIGAKGVKVQDFINIKQGNMNIR